jgi:hypothetical protein
MVLIKFDGEPTEDVGKDFNGNDADELRFPVLFWDERSVGEKFKPGEAANMIETTPGEVKVLAVQGGPLMRELLAEDEDTPLIGRYFILKHTGTGAKTEYELREVKVTRQAPVAQQADIEQDDEEEEYVQQVPAEEMVKQEKARRQKFHDKVAEHAAKAEKMVEAGEAEIAAVTKTRTRRSKKVETSPEAKIEQPATEDTTS